MEWTGIQNENEFYSAYFFSEGLMNALNERLKKWNEDETNGKEEVSCIDKHQTVTSLRAASCLPRSRQRS